MSSQEPIERLTVVIEADISKLLQQTAEGINRVEQKLDDMSGKGKRSFDDTGKAAEQSAVKMGVIIGVVQRITDGLLRLAGRAIKAFVGIGKAAIDANADMEMLTVQFTTLLGSAEAAQERIQELIKFNIRTPFTLPEIVEASRVLQIFGGTVLATGDNLELVGDIAAGVGRPFNEVALWVGRAYDAFQSGRPFGLAGLALQRMGALTGKARNELERMQKAGASGAELWERFQELVGAKFAGNLERMSKTLRGVISNLIDFSQNLLRIAGQEAFEEIRAAATRLFEILQSNQPELERVAKAFGEIADTVARISTDALISFVESLDFEQMIEFANDVNEMVDSIELLGEVLGEFDMENPFARFVQDVQQGIKDTKRDLENIAKFFAGIQAEIARRQAEAASLIARGKGTRVGPLLIGEPDAEARIAGEEAYQKAIAESERLFDDFARKRHKAPRRGRGAAPGVAPPIAPDVEDFSEEADKLRDLAGELTNDMLDAREDMYDKLEELNRDHAKRMVDIDRDLAEDLAKLARDTADKREDIFEGTRRDLTKLEKDTDEKLADERADFQTEERRDTEDHLRDMRRLTEQYLFDLEDAVKERDARAVVDLQRRFAMEQQQREEDFSVTQGRDREDQDQKLAEIRQDEAERRQEILDAQAERLSDLMQDEARRRQEIELSHQRQREAEMLSYGERRADLQNALAERLADIAKGLADEESINEEHARRLLTMLNKTFGAGGDVDQLMNDFVARRRQRMVVEISFSEETAAIERARQTVAAIRSRIPRFQGGGMVPGPAGMPQLAVVEGGERILPVAQQNVAARAGEQRVVVEFTGSAPPGIRATERDQIAGVLLNALRETGIMGRGR